MGDKRLKILILALANCIVYSCFFMYVRMTDTIVDLIWMFSQYVSAFVAIIIICPLLELMKKRKET